MIGSIRDSLTPRADSSPRTTISPELGQRLGRPHVFIKRRPWLKHIAPKLQTPHPSAHSQTSPHDTSDELGEHPRSACVTLSLGTKQLRSSLRCSSRAASFSLRSACKPHSSKDETLEAEAGTGTHRNTTQGHTGRCLELFEACPLEFL